MQSSFQDPPFFPRKTWLPGHFFPSLSQEGTCNLYVAKTGFSTASLCTHTSRGRPCWRPPAPPHGPRSGRKGSSTTLIKSADDNKPGGAANSTREDGEINEKGPGEFRKYGTGNNKMRVDAEECK